MQVRLQAKDGPAVGSVPQTLAAVAQQLQQEQAAWLDRLRHDPSRFGEVERDVHHTFQQLADQVVAGLLGEVGRAPALEEARKKSH
jgi:hypothetical protein